MPSAGALTLAPHDPVATASWGQGGGGPANPQDLNRYAYVLNNPVRNTDPTGHCSLALPWTVPVCAAAGPPGWAAIVIATAVTVIGAAGGYALANAENVENPVGSVGGSGELSGASEPASSDTYTDLTDEKAKGHILEGDKTGGGHRYGTGTPGKSEFPQNMLCSSSGCAKTSCRCVYYHSIIR